MNTRIFLSLLMIATGGLAHAEVLRCTDLGCMQIPPTEAAYLVTVAQQKAGQGVSCAGECADGSDVHGTFRDPIAGVLGLTRMCRAKGGLKQGSVDCAD